MQTASIRLNLPTLSPPQARHLFGSFRARIEKAAEGSDVVVFSAGDAKDIREYCEEKNLACHDVTPAAGFSGDTERGG